MWPRSTTAGVIPAFFSKGDRVKELSIFVDESGDFGKFNEKSPYYIVSFVFHEQQNSIKDQVLQLDHSIALCCFSFGVIAIFNSFKIILT